MDNILLKENMHIWTFFCNENWLGKIENCSPDDQDEIMQLFAYDENEILNPEDFIRVYWNALNFTIYSRSGVEKLINSGEWTLIKTEKEYLAYILKLD